MRRISPLVALLLLGAVLGAAALGYFVGARQHPSPAGLSSVAGPVEGASKTERKVLYWYDPMVPGQKFDKPGKSPYMDMELVPRYADQTSEAGVRIDPRIAQNLGMQVAAVERKSMASNVTAVASVKLNERDVAIVQARSAGFVERVVPRAPGDTIGAGAPIAQVLVSEWAGAQAEYLAVRAAGDAELTAAARQRLQLLGMTSAQIGAVERAGEVRAVITIVAPIAGVVQEMGVRSGMTLSPGMTLARINGLSTVWLEAAVPESHAGMLVPGREVKASFAAYPGENFRGRIESVLPETNLETRTLRVRMLLPNGHQRLKAGMFAQVQIPGESGEVLTVPGSAVLRTGTRNLVFVSEQPGRFRPVAVELGAERDGDVAILAGLEEGQKVAVSGQFLIDSEASLQGLTAGAAQEHPTAAAGQPDGKAVHGEHSAATTTPPPSAPLHEASGTLTAIEGDSVTLSHGPVPTLQWGAMTMGFTLARAELAKGLKVGDAVRFRFRQSHDGFVVEQIEKSGDGK